MMQILSLFCTVLIVAIIMHMYIHVHKYYYTLRVISFHSRT